MLVGIVGIVVVTLRLNSNKEINVMSFVKEIVRFLRKTDEVDTIRSDTKDFLEQNDASVILDLIDKNRSNDKGMISGVLSAKEVKTSYTVMKDGKSYVLRRVGSRNLSSI